MYYATTGDSQLYGFKSLIPDNIKKGLSYCIYAVHCNAGSIAEEKGLDELKSRYPDKIVFVPHQKNVGDTIIETGSFGQVVCLFHFVYETDEERTKIIKDIQSEYQVLDKSGRNLVNNKLLV